MASTWGNRIKFFSAGDGLVGVHRRCRIHHHLAACRHHLGAGPDRRHRPARLEQAGRVRMRTVTQEER